MSRMTSDLHSTILDLEMQLCLKKDLLFDFFIFEWNQNAHNLHLKDKSKVRGDFWHDFC